MTKAKGEASEDDDASGAGTSGSSKREPSTKTKASAKKDSKEKAAEKTSAKDDKDVKDGEDAKDSATKGKSAKDKAAAKKKAEKKEPNALGRGILSIVKFIRETVSELRKVIWPTRNDIVRYTIVTVIFVTLLVSFVWALDYGLAKAVLHLFGDPNAGNDSGVSG